jgi:hypothetical protein
MPTVELFFDASSESRIRDLSNQFASFESPLMRESSVRPHITKLTNDSYVILIGTKNFTERYYRDKAGWLKVSGRGRPFRITAEQVLNHLLPAVAGVKPNLTIKVEHRDVGLR